MKIFRLYLPVILFLILVAAVACREDEIPKTPPVASFQILPANGLTTTVFQFDATASKATNKEDTMLFIRWDWDNDNIWDTGFSRSKKFSHRYYVPGAYEPRMEIRNDSGLSDTMSLAVQVGRGYSAPRPSFTIVPTSGNLRTEFRFDASATRDDEDSLNTLKFRWDFEGDGIFDTGYSDETSVTHMYSGATIYDVKLEVADPQGLTATLKKSVSVSLSNPNLKPSFSWTPEKPNTSDTVILDASASYDPEHPDNRFTYRWNIGKDEEWDSEYLTSPKFGFVFSAEGDNQVILEIRDQWGLINQSKSTIFIGHANRKPNAAIFTGHDWGNLTTNFYFDAIGASDTEDISDWLQVRWDFESDGVWDTEYAKAKTVYHKYGVPGTFRARVQVIDTGGLTDTIGISVNVTNGTNETGLILDRAKNISYGTVKIGNQWWMSENLNEVATRNCYSNQSTNCAKYGGLYTWLNAMGLVYTEKARGLCPTGWHIPTIAEWETLMNNFPTDQAKVHLEDGGDSDFRMFYAGQRSINGRSELLNTVTTFWSSTKSSGENAFVISFQKSQDPYFKINLAGTYSFSVRCVKD